MAYDDCTFWKGKERTTFEKPEDGSQGWKGLGKNILLWHGASTFLPFIILDITICSGSNSVSYRQSLPQFMAQGTIPYFLLEDRVNHLQNHKACSMDP